MHSTNGSRCARRVATALVLGIAVAATPAGAQEVRGFVSAGLLSAWCQRDTPVDVEGCLSYLRATFDTLTAIHAGPGPTPIAADIATRCIPDRVAVAELRGHFLDDMAAHPEHRERQAAAQLLSIITEHYAC